MPKPIRLFINQPIKVLLIGDSKQRKQTLDPLTSLAEAGLQDGILDFR